MDLPRLAFGTFAIGLPCLVLVIVLGLFEVSGGNISNQSLQALAFNLLIFPPPIAATLVAGFLADRSSYLAGLIVGLVAGVLFAVYVLTANFAPSNGELVTDAIRQQNAIYAMLVSPVAGLLFGSFGGLCRRLVLTLKV